MVTFIGSETEFGTLIADLIELDNDAAAAYQAAIDRLENEDYKAKLREFKGDHERHVRELSQLLEQKGITPPEGGRMKQILTKGRVVIAQLAGDDAILKAMKANEDDTNTAYENANKREDAWTEAMDILERGLQDEHRHRQWIEKIVG
jgi:uncharacterized protein (TIGR02284 family)